MESSPHPITFSLSRGAAKGWLGFVWMIKIILPVSLATFLLDYSGWLERMDGWLEPMMGIIHLPPEAALPMVAGMLTGIYGAVAAMSVLALTVDQMTLIAVFLLIAHSLIQEGLVQHRSGCPAWAATAVRLTAAVLTVYVLGWVLGSETVLKTTGDASNRVQIAFWAAMRGWSLAMAWLSAKLLLIISALMIFMEFLKQHRIIDKLVRLIEPFLGMLGLDRRVGMLWLTAAVFGITYGGAVIVAESRERRLSPELLKPLHVSIGINHALVEDPALFLPLGIHPFWLWIPRLATAVIFTHAYRLWLLTQKHRRPASMCARPVDGV